MTTVTPDTMQMKFENIALFKGKREGSWVIFACLAQMTVFSIAEQHFFKERKYPSCQKVINS